MKQSKKKQTEQHRWVRDSVKEQYWRTQLALWQRSGLSVRAYCKEHGVVESSFYAWRRELIIRSRESGSTEEVTSPERMTPNKLKDGRGRTVSIRFRQTDQAALLNETEKPNPFVPVRIVQTTENPETNEPEEGKEAIQRGLEIALPGGAVIRLQADCNVRLVAELLSALKGQGEA